jgi:hypothetical protein
MARLFPTADPDHRYPRVTSARVLAALFDVAVGVRLLCPDEILTDGSAYALIERHFFGDIPLGIGLLLFGGVMTASLYTDRLLRATDVANLLALLTWVLFAVDLTITNVSQLGTLVYALVAAMHGYAYAHLSAWRDQLRRSYSEGPA